MLKIKDDVDLKILEKYGFKEVKKNIYNFRGKTYSRFDNYINEKFKYYYIIEPYEYILISNINEIVYYCDDEMYDFILSYSNVLYDLIKDGLVEKVSDD